MKIIDKIIKKITKLRLQPIHIYDLHHVCKKFDDECMNLCDWMPIDEFQNKVLTMRQSGIEFISLSDAYHHICNDWFRRKKYAVITFDDGYASLKEILPWLQEHNIPVTLFINPDYAAGKAYRKTPKEKYLTIEELSELAHTPYTVQHTPMVEIGMHGLQHIDVSQMNEQKFINYAKSSITETSKLNGYIPFWAYTWGRHSVISDKILADLQIPIVLVDGMINYSNRLCLHRELLTT